MRKLGLSLGILVVLAAILTSALVASRPALASRNSSGSYSLPSGNPVVSGTTITANWANSTLNDIGTELTNSLDRYGRGAMVGQLKLEDGTAAAPGLTFSSEQGSGLYRAAVGDVRLSVLGSDEATFDASGTTITQPLTCSVGVSSTGTGSGAGVTGTGGSSGGAGILGTGGATNGIGVKGTGAGVGTGVYGEGGSGGGMGVDGVGHGTAPGVSATAGSTSTASSRFDALQVHNGDIDMHDSVSPASTTGFSNRLTKKNLVKAWGHVTFSGTAWSVADGFNVGSITTGASPNYPVTINLADTMAASVYAVIVTASAGCAGDGRWLQGVQPNSFTLELIANGTQQAPTVSCELSFMVLGEQ